MANTVTTTSEKYSLKLSDALRGLLIAVITAVITTVYEAVKQGGLSSIEWGSVGGIAVSAGLAYLVKNFFTPAEIVIVNPMKSEIDAVKAGAEVKVIK